MAQVIRWLEVKQLPAYVKGGAMGLVDGAPVYACGMTHPWRETEVAWWLDTERNVAGSGWCAARCDETIFLLGGNYPSGPGAVWVVHKDGR